MKSTVGAGIVLRLVTVINRSWPVTMHDDQDRSRKEGGYGGPLKLLTWAFGRWTIDSSLPSSTACFGGCSPNTGERKLKNRQFLWGGRFGRSLLCPGRAEKKTRGSWPPTRVLTCRQKQTWSRFVAWWERSLIPDRQTDTHTHTQTHGIKAVWTARAPALARTWPPARINSTLAVTHFTPPLPPSPIWLLCIWSTCTGILGALLPVA